MTEREQKAAAKKFAAKWKGKGSEKSDSQTFWLSLLRDVYGVESPDEFIVFEKPVQLSNASFIDAYIPVTKVLIEQKSLGVSLEKQGKQSDKAELTPFEQAKRYNNELPYDDRARWIVVCNFAEWRIHDMKSPRAEPQIVRLENLQEEYHRLQFLVDEKSEKTSKEMEVSLQAGELVGALYDALLNQYKDKENPETLQSLNKLCVRIVFCLYADKAGVFGRRDMFHDYLAVSAVRDARRALIDLFVALDTRPEDRDPYMDEALAAFPYVNGGLFADEHIEIPRLDEGIVSLLLNKTCAFDWSQISPTIFGAVFESTLNPETRRSGGMHYTSIENIHKVIDPLFLDDLRAELEGIKAETVVKTKAARLVEFQKKLGALTFLDPACGSGNFLTETYLSLRRLENEALSILQEGQIVFGELEGEANPIKVSIGQFYGIEINDFAVTVAKTALWIAESQMLKETEHVVQKSLDFLPLKTYANIAEGNALRMDWEGVIPKAKLGYIMGNPPFVGYAYQSAAQKEDLQAVSPCGSKNIDYVAGWYFKTALFIKDTSVRAAFVSTNSITQGEQVAAVWRPLFEEGVHIDFAHRTFRWDSEATEKAAVHCVIVGFSVATNEKPKVIYSDGHPVTASNINGYLLDAPNVCIERRSKPLCDVPPIGIGNQPIDGGFYLFIKEEMEEFIKKEPASAKWFRPWYGSQEFISQEPRYCLWLGECPPNELRKMPECLKRVEAVREFRLKSTRAKTQKMAESPLSFDTENMPSSNYIVIPKVSSEMRRYIPIGFMTPDVLCGDAVFIIPDATLYHFGVLTSNVHMAWTRSVCGRLKSDYRYSKDIVYNNFPWPQPTNEQKAKIEETAQGILDARALYPEASLADLYDGKLMKILYPKLREAHKANDRAVIKAYGFDAKMTDEAREGELVAELMNMYQLTAASSQLPALG